VTQSEAAIERPLEGGEVGKDRVMAPALPVAGWRLGVDAWRRLGRRGARGLARATRWTPDRVRAVVYFVSAYLALC